MIGGVGVEVEVNVYFYWYDSCKAIMPDLRAAAAMFLVLLSPLRSEAVSVYGLASSEAATFDSVPCFLRLERAGKIECCDTSTGTGILQHLSMRTCQEDCFVPCYGHFVF